MSEIAFNDLGDKQLRADVAEEILDTTKTLLDCDTRTIGMTYGEAQRFIDTSTALPLDEELRRATVESIDTFHIALGTRATSILYPDSQYRMVAAGADALGHTITYSLTDVRTGLKGLSRVMKMSMSDQTTRRLRGIALSESGEVHTTSEILTKKTENFELEVRTLIGDELSDMRDALLTGRELPFETVVECLDIIRKSLELSQPDMNIDAFMATLYNHYDYQSKIAQTRQLVYGGTSEMPTEEMIALRNYMDGDDSAVGIYNED
jgi:hypothetical protein